MYHASLRRLSSWQSPPMPTLLQTVARVWYHVPAIVLAGALIWLLRLLDAPEHR